MNPVTVRQETITIPTYEISAYDKNPMFLEKRVYQGSSGRVYPHPVCEGVSDEKTDKTYQAIYLENDYLLVMILPEIGGRIQRLYDKTNGYDAVYYNEVIKPALVGLAGPWISGGIEFNWPQHHRPSTFDAVDYTIEEHDDGSKTVCVGEIEKMFHTKGSAAYTLYPDKAYLEIKGSVYNPTDRAQTFLWWANPAVAVGDHTQSIFPPDVHAVMDHGKRDVSTFPIATGTYYKVDYSAGVDISRYRNIPVPTSYMAAHSDYDFIGNYDEEKKAGLLHIADHHVSPGKKQWTWGCGDFGKAWDRNLTDENGPYIELMTGMFTDNQPDFTFLKPYEEKTFVQYFLPYKGVGCVRNASTELVINPEITENEVHCRLYAPGETGELTLLLSYAGEEVSRKTLSLHPAEYCSFCVPLSVSDPTLLTFTVLRDGKELLHYTPEGPCEEPIPSPAEAIPTPEELPTTEKLYLSALHLEQYRHATRSPEPYYLEGLRRDPSDLRLNNGYGKWLYGRGLFAQSEPYFRAAIQSATWKNPNPYDCEPYYNLGLSLEAQGRQEEAFDAYYKATWDGSMQARAFYRLSCIETKRGKYEEALSFAEKSLLCGLHNRKARTLKTALLRLLGRREEAFSFAKDTQQIDPLERGCRYELYRLSGEEKDLEALLSLLRAESHNVIELSLDYSVAGLREDAIAILDLEKASTDPMHHYYRYALTGDVLDLQNAEASNSLYCFPNRLEDIAILQHAIDHGGAYAAYYLGCLFYDKGRDEEAVALWESCRDKITLPTVYRNLALAYYNKQHDPVRARAAMEKAFSMDPADARVFFELDQLYRVCNLSVAERLANMEAHGELLAKRDDLYTEYITLCNLTGEYEKAYHCIMTHHFHPWEGGEGKIPTQYRIALKKAAKAHPENAVALLRKALTYPENLGEGKLAGAMDNDLYYLLGQALTDEEEKRTAFTLAARGEGVLSSAQYYNDQPPELMYYAALALRELGQEEEAMRRFDAFLEYGTSHMEDAVSIDYFAVSLPDFLIFEGDLAKKNQVHCCLMLTLGYLGKGDLAEARKWLSKGLSMDCCHLALNELAGSDYFHSQYSRG